MDTLTARKKRAQRPRVVPIDVGELVNAWGPLAQQRVTTFHWNGTLYGKPTRQTAADRDGLIAHKEPLMALLAVCPSAFPCHSGVRAALIEIDDKMLIIGCDRRFQHKIASEAADIWRVMCKDLYDLKKNPRAELPELQSILDAVTITHRSEDAASSDALSVTAMGAVTHSASATASATVPQKASSDAHSATATAPPLDAEAVKGMFAGMFSDDDCPVDVSDDELDVSDGELDVTFVAEVCRCPECVAGADALDAKVRIPNPRKGAQRTETLPAQLTGTLPFKRLRQKTSPRKDPAVGTLPAKRQTRRVKRKKGGVKKPVMKPPRLRKHHAKNAASEQIKTPVAMVERCPTKKRCAEAYLLANGRYFVGMSSKRSPHYAKAIRQLRSNINMKMIKTKTQALTFLVQYAKNGTVLDTVIHTEFPV